MSPPGKKMAPSQKARGVEMRCGYTWCPWAESNHPLPVIKPAAYQSEQGQGPSAQHHQGQERVCGLPAALGSRSVPSHRKENHAFCERMEDIGPVPIPYSHYNRDNRDKRDKRDKLKNLFCDSMPFQEVPSFA